MTADFDESVLKFKSFAEQHGWSPNLIWVRPDDVVFDSQGQLFVRVPVPVENERVARTTFENGIRTRRGVLFATLRHMQSGTCCYAWTPKLPIEAEYHRMPEGLKMSVRTGESRLHGKALSNAIHWLCLRWRYRKNQKQNAWLFE